MSFLELAAKRSSCRFFLPRPVDRSSLERCCEAARLAPSACNSQPWYFIIVESAPARKKLAAATFSGIYAMNSFAGQAGCLVCVLTEPSKFIPAAGGALRGTKFNRIDVGMAVSQFILQAEEEGLATCLIGWFNERAVKKTLSLPWSKKIDILIAVGYAAAPADGKIRRPREEMRRFI